MALAAYSKPEVRDYGTLLEVTSHVDVNFLGAVSNLVLAAISGPLPPHGTISQTGSGGNAPIHGGGAGGGGILGIGAGGGKLPFTGLSTVLVAAIGAALASAGASLRMLVRRRVARRTD